MGGAGPSSSGAVVPPFKSAATTSEKTTLTPADTAQTPLSSGPIQSTTAKRWSVVGDSQRPSTFSCSQSSPGDKTTPTNGAKCTTPTVASSPSRWAFSGA